MSRLKHIFFFLFVGSFLAACMKSGDLKIAKNSTPQQLDDGWTVANPQTVGFNTSALNQAIDLLFDEDLYLTSKSLLIIKDNKLVLESYCRDLSDRDRMSNLRSMTKSVTNVLFGIAIDHGLFDNDLSRTLYSYIPYYFDSVELKRDISLFHLFTMRTGWRWDNLTHNMELFNTRRYPSSMRVVIQKPMDYAPGVWFNFNDGTPHILSGMIADTAHMSLEEFAVENLFSKIGIENYYWEKHTDSLNYGSLGLYLKPRDMAKFGQLMLQNGVWDSEQVVSSSWINESTSTQLPAAYTLSEPYGYYWWIRPENNAYTAIGEGGQYIYVVPAQNLVIVHTAMPFTGLNYRGITLSDFEEIVELILQALS
jgi:CubicO group peptidase (beta-lactamase class C family)